MRGNKIAPRQHTCQRVPLYFPSRTYPATPYKCGMEVSCILIYVCMTEKDKFFGPAAANLGSSYTAFFIQHGWWYM